MTDQAPAQGLPQKQVAGTLAEILEDAIDEPKGELVDAYMAVEEAARDLLEDYENCMELLHLDSTVISNKLNQALIDLDRKRDISPP